MREHFNKLTPAEAERLAKLAEECGEVIQAVCKILRHGYDSVNPDDPSAGNNREQLTREFADLAAAWGWMISDGDIDYPQFDSMAEHALTRGMQYSHHQET